MDLLLHLLVAEAHDRNELLGDGIDLLDVASVGVAQPDLAGRGRGGGRCGLRLQLLDGRRHVGHLLLQIRHQLSPISGMTSVPTKRSCKSSSSAWATLGVSMMSRPG